LSRLQARYRPWLPVTNPLLNQIIKEYNPASQGLPENILTHIVKSFSGFHMTAMKEVKDY
jgi:hypothetical protein